MTGSSTALSRIVVVDDHLLLRQALCRMAESDARFQVVGEADSGAAAMDLVHRTYPDIAILDISLNGSMDGLQLAENLKPLHPNLKILLLSLHGGPEFLAKGKAVGANGFLNKGDAAERLLEALEVIANGDPYGF